MLRSLNVGHVYYKATYQWCCDSNGMKQLHFDLDLFPYMSNAASKSLVSLYEAASLSFTPSTLPCCFV